MLHKRAEGVIKMSWIWAPVFFVIGALFGIIITTLIAYDNATLNREKKRWWDDE